MSRWRLSERFIPLTRALPALYTCTIRRAGTSTRFLSSDAMSTTGIAGKSAFGNGHRPAEYRRIYVWEMPVRAYHWINAIALTVLCITGYMIGAPVKLGSGTEAYQQYWFGTVRFLHFL